MADYDEYIELQSQLRGDSQSSNVISEEDWRKLTNLFDAAGLPGNEIDIVEGVFGTSTSENAHIEKIVKEQLNPKSQRTENPSDDSSQEKVSYAADPVMMFNGQFTHEVDDIRINGAGIGFVFKRTYKNQVPFNGSLGFNWTHNFHIWLRVANQTIFRSTGDLREEAFTKHPKFGEGLTDDFDYWIPPDGKNGVIFADADGDTFFLRMPNGVRYQFEQDLAHPFLHRLEKIEDRHGNYLELSYTDDLLHQVKINHSTRVVEFDYDSQRRICRIRDYMNRQWHYSYDSSGDLITVTSPTTNRYGCGLTVSYDYSSAFQTGALQHNMIRIIDAAGQIYLETEYGSSPGMLNFNRVVRQRQGGGEYSFEYEDIIAELDFDYPDEQRPVHQTILVERNGHPIRHVYNKFGNLLLKEQCIIEKGLPRTLAEQYRYNLDGNVIATLSPEGVLTQHLYGRDYFVFHHPLTPNGEIPTGQLTWRERQAFGRLRSTVARDGYAGFSTINLTQGQWGPFPSIVDGIFPSGMGKRENDIIIKFTYESEYGQLRTISDPRYTISADPNALNEHPRHNETLTENIFAPGPTGDSNRYLIEIKQPTPTLPDGSPGGDVRVQFINADGTPGYDSKGRLLRQVNPIGVITENVYFPEDVTDPREGHLQRTVIDPDDLNITTEFEVDELGRVEAVHLPRSVEVVDDRFVTRTTYNELDQVVEVTSSKPFKFKAHRFYDRNGKLEREELDAKDENGTDIPDAPVVRTFCYDEEFKPIQETIGGADLSTHLVTRHRYDGTGQRVLTLLPGGNQVRYRYDERLLPIEVTMGAGTEDAATTRTEYDGDGRVHRAFDARGNPTTFTFDSFGRTVAVEDSLGHIVRQDYDKLGNVSVVRAFEKREDGYYLLTRNETEYDELGRAFRTIANRFDDPQGPKQKENLATAYLNTPILGNAPLVSQIFYDAQGRVIKTIDPLLREYTTEYDKLDRVFMTTDPLGNQVTNRYDQHSNLIRSDSTDLERDPDNVNNIIGQRAFSGSFIYDELDRMVSSTDTLGNVTEFFYDSRGNQVRSIDPLGNVTHMEYDIHNRGIEEQRELTETGLGGSTVTDTANIRFKYDKNSNLITVIDAQGRRTKYTYDALNRQRAIIYPDNSKFLSDFDTDSNLIRTTDNNGLQRIFTVDELGRTTRVSVDTSGITGIQVGGATFEQYAYDGLDRLYREENDYANCEIRLNSLSWPVEETITFTTADAPVNTPFVITREYNNVGAQTDLTFPNGRKLHFNRDSLDRLTRIQNIVKGTGYPGNAATPDVHDVVTRIEYAGLQRSRCRFGNGAVATYAHDGAARVIEIVHSSPIEPLLRIQYLFDSISNVRIRNDVDTSNTMREAFAYDSLYRLVNEGQHTDVLFDPTPLAPASTLVSGPIPNRQADINLLIGPLTLPVDPITYEYDLVGNRERERDGSEINYVPNELDQYESLEITNGVNTTTHPRYDANGNLKDDDEQRKYIYDSLNRLVQVSEGGVTVEFFHDASGRRIMELVNGSATQLICDGDNLIAEYSDGSLLAQYVHNDGIDRPVQIVAEGNEHWYQTDLVGSVRLLTNQTGNEVVNYRYTPFGEMAATPAGGPYNPLGYTARRLDLTLGTYDYRARQYDPELGRFLQRDPKVMVDGTNLYSYTSNNPLSYLDMFGTNRKESEIMMENLQNSINLFIDSFTVESWQRKVVNFSKGFTKATLEGLKNTSLAYQTYKSIAGTLEGVEEGSLRMAYYSFAPILGAPEGLYRGVETTIDAVKERDYKTLGETGLPTLINTVAIVFGIAKGSSQGVRSLLRTRKTLKIRANEIRDYQNHLESNPHLRKYDNCDASAKAALDKISGGKIRHTTASQRGHSWYELNKDTIIDPSLKSNLKEWGVPTHNLIGKNQFAFPARFHKFLISKIPKSGGKSTNVPPQSMQSKISFENSHGVKHPDYKRPFFHE